VRELFIIRHAVAHERDASKWPNDDQRPLTDDGIRKFQRAARGLSRLIEPPDELLTSTLTRARQTAALLVNAADFPAPIELAPLRPDTPAKTLIAALAKRRPLRVAIVGHEPDLSQLLGVLLGAAKARVELKKGACAQLSFTGRIEAGAGQLISLWPPRTLREVARKG
jgi:phosphohistidine phosphatase